MRYNDFNKVINGGQGQLSPRNLGHVSSRNQDQREKIPPDINVEEGFTEVDSRRTRRQSFMEAAGSNPGRQGFQIQRGHQRSGLDVNSKEAFPPLHSNLAGSHMAEESDKVQNYMKQKYPKAWNQLAAEIEVSTFSENIFQPKIFIIKPKVCLLSVVQNQFI